MGIKMDHAFDQNGARWEADTYTKGTGTEPLQCKCGTPVTHNPPYTREMYDKSVFVQGYFRLYPKGAHAANCRFGVDEEITEIAKTSEDLIESIQHSRYRMRLVMIKEALEKGRNNHENDEGTRAKAGRTYAHNPNPLPAYINSAKRALKLRALCDDDHDIEQYLELVFEGNVKVAWNQFYFEPERHQEAFYAVSHNTVQHPIAIQGAVSSIRTEIQGDKTRNVINLQMNKFRADPDDSENGIGLEVSIWAREAAWFKGIQRDDEIIVLGMWKHSTTAPEKAPREGHFKTLTKRRLTLTLALKAQVSKIE
ncbi:hypothetical protein PSCICN_26220 [Pseudomonas cichorii]|uniref:hypothetical protein n=1 Tax=Pseudomonas cichorii TaxID=36746 RepID=UPI0019111321|nr:hypothetical protein [Pseudomonas cichorii]GFM81930.1 hypothetical protein PSCICN_26220 [Pseudomonas cichorii]